MKSSQQSNDISRRNPRRPSSSEQARELRRAGHPNGAALVRGAFSPTSQPSRPKSSRSSHNKSRNFQLHACSMAPPLADEAKKPPGGHKLPLLPSRTSVRGGVTTLVDLDRLDHKLQEKSNIPGVRLRHSASRDESRRGRWNRHHSPAFISHQAGVPRSSRPYLSFVEGRNARLLTPFQSAAIVGRAAEAAAASAAMRATVRII